MPSLPCKCRGRLDYALECKALWVDQQRRKQEILALFYPFFFVHPELKAWQEQRGGSAAAVTAAVMPRQLAGCNVPPAFTKGGSRSPKLSKTSNVRWQSQWIAAVAALGQCMNSHCLALLYLAIIKQTISKETIVSVDFRFPFFLFFWVGISFGQLFFFGYIDPQTKVRIHFHFPLLCWLYKYTISRLTNRWSYLVELSAARILGWTYSWPSAELTMHLAILITTNKEKLTRTACRLLNGN